MADTTFTNNVTLTDADWFQDVNRLHYTIFGDPADKAAARRTLLDGMEKITNSLSGNVALNNTGSYFTGPTIAQGTSGTWLVFGTVTLTDTAGAANFRAKLWDGTTVISSSFVHTDAANNTRTLSLSGYIVSPAGDIRISIQDETSTSGVIAFNTSGNSKDSTITAIRIA